jgi:hypothetical protein
VTSLVLGVLSFLTTFFWFMIVIPVAGIGLGLWAVRRVTNSPGEKTGRGMAVAGVILSLVIGSLGLIVYYYVVLYGAPIGYSIITFNDLQPDKAAGEILPPAIKQKEGKFVFIKGYMYPGRQSMNVQQFVLVPTQAHCKFCQRDLASTEMIRVKMVGDEMADYSTQMIGVGGILNIDEGQALNSFGGLPYEIGADVFRD